jgi:hypothetical protein
MENAMASVRVDFAAKEWTSGVPFYGPVARLEGRDIAQLKVLSDRRRDGGGIAWIVRVAPPPGKLTKIIATTRGAPETIASILKASRTVP